MGRKDKAAAMFGKRGAERAGAGLEPKPRPGAETRTWVPCPRGDTGARGTPGAVARSPLHYSPLPPPHRARGGPDVTGCVQFVTRPLAGGGGRRVTSARGAARPAAIYRRGTGAAQPERAGGTGSTGSCIAAHPRGSAEKPPAEPRSTFSEFPFSRR